jgi:hypothetical protein
MATVTCRQETNAAQQGNERLDRSPQGLDCGTNRLRGAKPKHTWRPEYDAHLKAQYFGGLSRRSRVLNRMTRLTGLPRWYIKRQAARLGLTMRVDRRVWTLAEVNLLQSLVGCVSTATIAKRLHRPESSVVNKLRRMAISSRRHNDYTIRDLELALGEDHKKIAAWIAKGWLRDHRLGTGRLNDIHRIREKDLLRFIKDHPEEIRLGCVEPLWFFDLVLLKGRRVGRSNS